MKRLLILGLLLAGCSSPATPPTQTLSPSPAESPAQAPTGTPTETGTPGGWTSFDAPDGSFSVLLPGTADIQEDEAGFEVTSRAEPGAQVEIDLERFATPKLAAQRHAEKIKDARTGKVKGEKREGDRVVLRLEDSRGAVFTNALVLAGDRVIDVMAVGEQADVDRLLDSLQVASKK